MMNDLDSYDLGYQHGYDDILNENPFIEDSKDYEQYEQGYKDSCRNS